MEIAWKLRGLRSCEQVVKSFYSTIELQSSSWTPTWTPLVHCHNIHWTTLPIRTTLTRHSVHFSPPTSKLHKVAALDCQKFVAVCVHVHQHLGMPKFSSVRFCRVFTQTVNQNWTVGGGWVEPQTWTWFEPSRTYNSSPELLRVRGSTYKYMPSRETSPLSEEYPGSRHKCVAGGSH